MFWMINHGNEAFDVVLCWMYEIYGRINHAFDVHVHVHVCINACFTCMYKMPVLHLHVHVYVSIVSV